MSEPNSELKPHILLVDNDPLSQGIIKEMLEHCGCRVDLVGNGREAVDAFSRQPFDMIFMDCNIPEIDVYKATAIIRGLEAGTPGRGATARRIPITVLAASSSAGDREQYLRSGMDDYLAKPCRIADLQAMLDKWLSVPQTESSPSAPGKEGNPPAIDQEALNALASLQPQGAKALLTKLISVYFDSSAKQMKSILDAIRTDDVASLLTAAHTLKSSSASLGAKNFAEQCKGLEMMARSGEIGGAKACAAPLEREYERVREALHLYLTSLEG
jgi:two-component system, sensor histidine kinase and response regulator